MVISYIMGWGDAVHSHHYSLIFWSNFFFMLLKLHPLLCSANDSGESRWATEVSAVDVSCNEFLLTSLTGFYCFSHTKWEQCFVLQITVHRLHLSRSSFQILECHDILYRFVWEEFECIYFLLWYFQLLCVQSEFKSTSWCKNLLPVKLSQLPYKTSCGQTSWSQHPLQFHRPLLSEKRWWKPDWSVLHFNAVAFQTLVGSPMWSEAVWWNMEGSIQFMVSTASPLIQRMIDNIQYYYETQHPSLLDVDQLMVLLSEPGDVNEVAEFHTRDDEVGEMDLISTPPLTWEAVHGKMAIQIAEDFENFPNQSQKPLVRNQFSIVRTATKEDMVMFQQWTEQSQPTVIEEHDEHLSFFQADLANPDVVPIKSHALVRTNPHPSHAEHHIPSPNVQYITFLSCSVLKSFSKLTNFIHTKSLSGIWKKL